jgi:hypothetical protein
MTALDNITPLSSYDGVPFYRHTGAGGIKSSPRFESGAILVERVAPFSFPANVVRQVINTGILSDMTVQIAITGPNLALLRSKVETGMKSLILAGDASQSAILTKVGAVEAVTSLGYIYVTCTFRGRG